MSNKMSITPAAAAAAVNNRSDEMLIIAVTENGDESLISGEQQVSEMSRNLAENAVGNRSSVASKNNAHGAALHSKSFDLITPEHQM